MIPNLGQTTTNPDLAAPSPTPDLVDHLNQTVQPNKSLTSDDIYIRTLLVTSTAVNAYGGRFDSDDLPHLCDLLVDSPVLVGHRKDALPIARVFHADIVHRDNSPWVRAWCYWLKSADGASTLRDNIDGGIYKECSLSFTYQIPECSICGKDIRLCRHEPFTSYPVSGGRPTCHFVYRRIEKVLETSLVYRGAVENTRVGSHAAAADTPLLIDFSARPTVADLDDLSADNRYLMTPAYDGIPVSLSLGKSGFSIRSLSHDILPESLASQFNTRYLGDLTDCFGLLVGYHGKERCSCEDLRRYLHDTSRPVTRLVVHLFPHPAIRLPLPPYPASPHSICPISYRIAGAKEIPNCLTNIKSKLGVDLWPLDGFPPSHPGWRYHPTRADTRTQPRFTVTPLHDRALSLLSLDLDDEQRHFIVHQFDLRALLRGCRFVTDLAPHGTKAERALFSNHDSSASPATATLSGVITRSAAKHDAVTFTAERPMRGHFVIRPVLLDSRPRFLFYRKRE